MKHFDTDTQVNHYTDLSFSWLMPLFPPQCSNYTVHSSFQGGALLGNVNALFTSFPADPGQQYRTRCQLLLEGLNLPLLLQKEMNRLARWVTDCLFSFICWVLIIELMLDNLDWIFQCLQNVACVIFFLLLSSFIFLLCIDPCHQTPILYKSKHKTTILLCWVVPLQWGTWPM